MKRINTINDIDWTTAEGQLLFAAIQIFASTWYNDLHPDEIIKLLNERNDDTQRLKTKVNEILSKLKPNQ